MSNLGPTLSQWFSLIHNATLNIDKCDTISTKVDKNFDKLCAGTSSSLEVFCEKATDRKFPGTDIFLRILRYFSQEFFYRTSVNGWFCPRNYRKPSYQKQISSVRNCTVGRGGTLYSFGKKLSPRGSSHHRSVIEKNSTHIGHFNNLPYHPATAINPLQPGVAFLYPLRISENPKVF